MARKLLNYLLILVCILLAYGWAKTYLQGPDLVYSTAYRIKRVPVMAEETKRSEKIPEEIRCVQVVTKSPTIKQLEEIARTYEAPEFKIEWPDVTLLGEYKIPDAPYGGTAVVGVQDQQPFVVVKPKERPFFELGGMRELGIAAGVGANGTAWRGKLRQDLFRIGPVIGTAEVAVNGHGHTSYWSAMLEANVRF